MRTDCYCLWSSLVGYRKFSQRYLSSSRACLFRFKQHARAVNAGMERRSKMQEAAEAYCSKFKARPVGVVRSWFLTKSSAPRQGSVSSTTKAYIDVDPGLFTNPDHSLLDLDQFSHVWVVFLFHLNAPYLKAKVAPPRLDGKRVGVFSTRSPHRVNPIGLSLCRLDRVHGSRLCISGHDMLDGTPVLDIKPYIPQYDVPEKATQSASGKETGVDSLTGPVPVCKPVANTGSDAPASADITGLGQGREIAEPRQPGDRPDGDASREEPLLKVDFEQVRKSVEGTKLGEGFESVEGTKLGEGFESVEGTKLGEGFETVEGTKLGEGPRLEQMSASRVPEWINNPPAGRLQVTLTTRALRDLNRFFPKAEDLRYRFQFLASTEEAMRAITELLQEDPRSTYRRKECRDKLFYFIVDVMDLTVWFDWDENLAEVLRIIPISSIIESTNLQTKP